MKKVLPLLIISSALAAAPAVASVPVQKASQRQQMEVPAAKVAFNGKKSLLMRAENASDLKADFSVKGLTSARTVWSESFDGGTIPAGWTADPTENVTWSVKSYSSKPFSDIDPNDKGSLFVDGPYQVYKREISRMVSAPVEIGQNATLRGYVGYTLNWEDQSNLKIEVSADNFESDVTEIWNSYPGTGEKPWAWRTIEASLEAYAGKTVRFRFTYGPGYKDSFQTGGYGGSYYIDGLEITCVESVDGVDVETGDIVELADLSSGAEIASWEWSFPGATPASSTEQNPKIYYTADGDYDISLTVTDSEGRTSTVTRPGFVHVTGVAPTAKIGLPSTMRLASTGKYLVAPLAPVTFTDLSTGFPTSSEWTFTGASAEPNGITTASGREVSVGFCYQHEQTAFLQASNSHGTSTDMAEMSVEYSGIATNFRADDHATVFDLEGSGTFPGTNSMKITRFAEKFSKPSRPVKIFGAALYFTEAKAEEVADQIANVSVRLCKSENGLPGEELDFMCWSVFELDLPGAGGLTATEFPFTKAPVVDDEFFIVIDGLPQLSETCSVSFAMADFRAEGNTSYMFKDGQWVDVSTYFPAGKNHTSYLVQLDLAHSVMAALPDDWTPEQTAITPIEPEVVFGPEGGTKTCKIFSYMGWQTPVASTDDWCRVANAPNDMTVDDIAVNADPLPAGMTERTAELTLTDGVGKLVIPVRQTKSSSVAAPGTGSTLSAVCAGGMLEIRGGMPEAIATVCDLSGRAVATVTLSAEGAASVAVSDWAKGIYFLSIPGNQCAVKFVK